tara:strand:+ start:44 stop:229 length:186 start_codon:yes stop_codon:yes gene_type:complete
MKNQNFGDIEGFPEGHTFNSRIEIKNAGLHKYQSKTYGYPHFSYGHFFSCCTKKPNAIISG